MNKFEVGDKVKVTDGIYGVGKEGTVTRLGGVADPDIGAVVTNDTFFSGHSTYGEHGVWFPDRWLEKIETLASPTP